MATYSNISAVFESAYVYAGSFDNFIQMLDDPLINIFDNTDLKNKKSSPLSKIQREFLASEENKKVLIDELVSLEKNRSEIAAFKIWVPGATAVTAVCRPKYTNPPSSGMPIIKMFKNVSSVQITNLMGNSVNYEVLVPSHPVAELIILFDKMNKESQKKIIDNLLQVAKSATDPDDKFDAELTVNTKIVS